MLIPENQSEKERWYLLRFAEWVKTRPEKEQKLYCKHGRYVGFNHALAFMCSRCKEENNL